MRYSTRTLLLGVLVIALFITGIRWVQWQHRWRVARNELLNWASNIDRSDGKFEQYSAHVYGSYLFGVLTGEPMKINHTDGSTGWTTMPDLPEDPSRFFVIPPGIWVDDVDDVIAVWQHHFDEGLDAS